eukprot:4561881-Pleurochrysis_carterae.AAC.1
MAAASTGPTAEGAAEQQPQAPPPPPEPPPPHARARHHEGACMRETEHAHTPAPHDQLRGRCGATEPLRQGGREGSACPAGTPPRTGAACPAPRADGVGEHDG